MCTHIRRMNIPYVADEDAHVSGPVFGGFVAAMGWLCSYVPVKTPQWRMAEQMCRPRRVHQARIVSATTAEGKTLPACLANNSHASENAETNTTTVRTPTGCSHICRQCTRRRQPSDSRCHTRQSGFVLWLSVASLVCLHVGHSLILLLCIRDRSPAHRFLGWLVSHLSALSPQPSALSCRDELDGNASVSQVRG